jgi:hypothetical protein
MQEHGVIAVGQGAQKAGKLPFVRRKGDTPPSAPMIATECAANSLSRLFGQSRLLCGVFRSSRRRWISQGSHDLLPRQPRAVIAFDQQSNPAAVVDMPRPAHHLI